MQYSLSGYTTAFMSDSTSSRATFPYAYFCAQLYRVSASLTKTLFTFSAVTTMRILYPPVKGACLTAGHPRLYVEIPISRIWYSYSHSTRPSSQENRTEHNIRREARRRWYICPTFLVGGDPTRGGSLLERMLGSVVQSCAVGRQNSHRVHNNLGPSPPPREMKNERWGERGLDNAHACASTARPHDPLAVRPSTHKNTARERQAKTEGKRRGTG